MALLPCPECARDVSTRAQTCPHCGCPIGEAVVADAIRAGMPDHDLRELQDLALSPAQRAPATSLGRCPTCASDDLRSVPLVYEEGTHRVATTSATGAVGTVGGELAIGGATTTTTGSRQALLAHRLAPPSPRQEDSPGAIALGCLGVVVVGIAGAALLGDNRGAMVIGIGTLAWVLALGADAFKNKESVRWNAEELPRLRMAWERSVICMRCGTVSPLLAATDPA